MNTRCYRFMIGATAYLLSAAALFSSVEVREDDIAELLVFSLWPAAPAIGLMIFSYFFRHHRGASITCFLGGWVNLGFLGFLCFETVWEKPTDLMILNFMYLPVFAFAASFAFGLIAIVQRMIGSRSI